MPSAASHPAHAIYCQPAASFYTCPERRSPFAHTLCRHISLQPQLGFDVGAMETPSKTPCCWLKSDWPFDLTVPPNGQSGFSITGNSRHYLVTTVCGRHEKSWHSLAEPSWLCSCVCGQLTVGVAGSAHFLEDWWSSGQLGLPPGSQPTNRFQGLLVTDGKVSGSFCISFSFLHPCGCSKKKETKQN